MAKAMGELSIHMNTNNISFRISRPGEIVDFDLSLVLEALGIKDIDALGHVSLVVKDSSGCEIEALTHGEDACPPALYYQGINERGHDVEIGVTELPNDECHYIATHLFTGDSKTERNDWAVRIVDSPRPKGDYSRRAIYVDNDVACSVDYSEATEKHKMFNASTENQYSAS